MSELPTNPMESTSAAKVDVLPEVKKREIALYLVKAPHVDLAKFQAAIGCLAGWGIGYYPRTTIANDATGLITACYYDADGRIAYMIYAVWRKQEDGNWGYDFNS